MSISNITAADMINLTRPGGALTNAVDAGTGMNLDITGSISPSGMVTSPPNSGFLDPNTIVGATGLYYVQGEVDWDNIISVIPTSAQITAIQITAQANYSVSSIENAQRDSGAGGVGGTAFAIAYASLQIPNQAVAAQVNDNIDDTDIDNNPGPTSSIALSAGVSNASVILRKEWDFTSDPINYPLGYITYAQLVARFTVQRVTPLADNLIGALSAQGSSSYTAPGGGLNFSYSVTKSVTLVTTNWLMVVHWEEPVTWDVPNPPQVEDNTEVTVTSDPLDPDALLMDEILTGEIQFIDQNGDPQTLSVTFTVINVNLIIFIMPDFGSFEPEFVDLYITSSQFSGSLLLGRFVTIWLRSASGIYRIVTNKRNDTVYDEENLPDTYDIKIPDPFARGGFIGS